MGWRPGRGDNRERRKEGKGRKLTRICRIYGYEGVQGSGGDPFAAFRASSECGRTTLNGAPHNKDNRESRNKGRNVAAVASSRFGRGHNLGIPLDLFNKADTPLHPDVDLLTIGRFWKGLCQLYVCLVKIRIICIKKDSYGPVQVFNFSMSLSVRAIHQKEDD